MKSLSIKILNQIKKEHIKPIPRWFFIAKNIIFWIGFSFSIIIGAISFSLLLYLLKNHEWSLYQNLQTPFLNYFISTLPYFWIIASIFFLILSFYNFRKTKHGYQKKAVIIILSSISLSIVLGLFTTLGDFDEKVDQLLRNNISYYQKNDIHNDKVWTRVQNGLIAGKIVEIKNDNEFILKDLKNKNWTIYDQKSVWKNPSLRKINKEIRIIGIQKNEGVFVAKRISRWIGKKQQKITDNNPTNYLKENPRD